MRSEMRRFEKRISRSLRPWLRMFRSTRRRSVSGSGGGGGCVSRRERRVRRVVRRGERATKGQDWRCEGSEERGRTVEGQPR